MKKTDHYTPLLRFLYVTNILFVFSLFYLLCAYIIIYNIDWLLLFLYFNNCIIIIIVIAENYIILLTCMMIFKLIQ